MNLAPFSSLPPKPDHLRKVRSFLQRRGPSPVADVVSGTALTKTQVLCAMQRLVKDGLVLQDPSTKSFLIAQTAFPVAK